MKFIFLRFKEDETAMRFLNDPEAQQGYKNTKPLSACAASDYSAIFYVGGHGPGNLSRSQILMDSV
jgi:putative intracellular protease/amidase